MARRLTAAVQTVVSMRKSDWTVWHSAWNTSSSPVKVKVSLPVFVRGRDQCECDVSDLGASCPLWEPIETAEPPL